MFMKYLFRIGVHKTGTILLQWTIPYFLEILPVGRSSVKLKCDSTLYNIPENTIIPMSKSEKKRVCACYYIKIMLNFFKVISRTCNLEIRSRDGIFFVFYWSTVFATHQYNKMESPLPEIPKKEWLNVYAREAINLVKMFANY